MSNILSWKMGGVLLGLTFLLAVIFVAPIGVSTQFVIADGIIWDTIDPTIISENSESGLGFSSSNTYLNKYADKIANPLSYGFVFVLSMMAGAFLSSVLRGDRPDKAEKSMPAVWRDHFGDSKLTRYMAVFIAGFIVLFGARLAGGCTSGHMMSGIMQTALSGYLFAIATFAIGIPTAILMFRKKG